MTAAVPSGRAARFHPGSPAILQSSFAYSLLSYGLAELYHIAVLPDIAVKPDGKPFFPGFPGIHFSISHTKTYVLCALDASPVGADIEAIRPIDRKIYSRVLASDENPDDFFSFWVLKESLIKLYGKKPAPFSSIVFKIEGNAAVYHQEGICCALYNNIPCCAAAACSYEPFVAKAPELVPFKKLAGFMLSR